MTASPKPKGRKIGIDDIDELDAEARAFAERTGVPGTGLPAAARQGEGTVTPLKAARPDPSPSRRIHIDTPLYAIRALKERAADEDATMTYLVLTALRAIGIDIKDIDLEHKRRGQS